ncbi:thioredoxin domain-containing protein, partial [Acinetobacter baumannii]
GFTKESFDKCLTDQALLDRINTARTRAGEKFEINSTPTFFVNGKRLTGVNQVDDFAKLIDPILEGK